MNQVVVFLFFQHNEGGKICTNGQVMLLPPTNLTDAELFGVVAVCFGNTWGYICPEMWSDVDAQVICRQLMLPLTCE